MQAENWQAEYDRTRVAFRVMRELMNLTQKDAAKVLGISGGTVTNFELGRVLPQTETITRFQQQVQKWEKQLGRDVLERKAREKGSAYIPTVVSLRCDFECPKCGEMTPGPKETAGVQPLWCVWCGTSLGTKCPACGAVETRVGKKFCGECGGKLRAED